MEIEQVLSKLLEIEDPGERFTNDVMARIDGMAAGSPREKVVNFDARRRRPGRRILFGAVIVLAAAASMLALLSDSGGDSSASSPAASLATPAGGSPPVAGQPGPGLAGPDSIAPDSALSGTFTVRVAPLVTLGNDAIGAASAARFREDVIARLGRIADLRLVDGPADVDLRMVFDGVASPSSRTVGIDVGAPHALDEMEHLVDGDATDRLEYSRRQVHAVQYPGTEGFAGGVESGLHTEAFIDSPARSAELLVRMLRTRVFPLSGAMENELLASLRNARLSPDLRIDAFNDLLAIANRRGSTATLDAEALKAGAELALVVPGVTARRSLWESLLATGSTELVPYLVRGLYADTDSSSRLWILGRLTERFPADARVSEVLDDLSHGSSQVMRVAALRKLGIPNAEEEAALSAAVAAAINDVSLDDLQRLEAVGGLAESAASPGRIPVQLDDRTIRELGVVLMRASRNPAATDVVAKSMAVLGTLQGTAVREVLVEILRRPDQESAGATKASVRALRNSAVGLAATYCRGDAEVRSLLEGLAKGGPGQPPDAFAVMALHSVDKTNDARIFKQGASPR